MTQTDKKKVLSLVETIELHNTVVRLLQKRQLATARDVLRGTFSDLEDTLESTDDALVLDIENSLLLIRQGIERVSGHV